MIEPQFDGWRHSLGGTAVAALERFLEAHPETVKVLACTDNDDAGEKTAAIILELAGGSGMEVVRSYPFFGKDWNEALQECRNEVKPM